MTREEAVALLERYSNYEGLGIPNLAGCKEAMKVAAEALKEAYPELAESEDERIRKRLIEYFEGFSMGNAEVKWEGLNVQEVLVWLEKQKEQKPAEWSEEDEKMLKAIDLSLNCYSEGQAPALVMQISRERDWIKSLSERFNLQPKQEWSEEDETAFGDLMWCINQAAKSAKDENDMGNIWFAENWVKNRLKSLRPQYHGDVTMTEAYKMGVEAGEASHWKPSKEQMDALDKAIPVCMGVVGRDEIMPLESLCEQLNKL